MKPLYLLYGSEDLLRFEALDKLRDQAKKEGYNDRQVLYVESHFDWKELTYALQEVGLFAEKKLIELHVLGGKIGTEGSTALVRGVDLLETVKETTSLILFFPSLERRQTNSVWFQKIKVKAVVQEARKLALAQLPQFLKERLAEKGLDIEVDAALLFAEKVEGNLLAAQQEIEKLALLKEKGATVRLGDVERMIANVARFEVFQLSEAWMKGDKKRLVQLLAGLNKSDLEVNYLLALLAEDIRTLLRLKGGLAQKENFAVLRSRLRLWGNKEAAARQALRRLPTKKLIEALCHCAEIDQQIKGLAPADPTDSCRALLLSLVP